MTASREGAHAVCRIHACSPPTTANDDRERSPGPNGKVTTTQVNVEGSACINWFVALYRRLAAGRRESSPVVRRWLARLRSASKSAQRKAWYLWPPRVARMSTKEIISPLHLSGHCNHSCPLVSFVANWINAIRSIGNGLVTEKENASQIPT